MKIRFDFWDVLASLEAFLTCDHQDKDLVEILYNINHLQANKDDIFYNDILIYLWIFLHAVHSLQDMFYESPNPLFWEKQNPKPDYSKTVHKSLLMGYIEFMLRHGGCVILMFQN